jgi:hypothetical protein
MIAMRLIVSHYVTMAKARLKGLVAQLYDLGFKCIFGMDDVEIISVDSSNLIFKGFRYENLYLVDFNAREAQLSTCLVTKSSMGWL